MICPNCQKEVEDNINFCNYCGANLKEVPEKNIPLPKPPSPQKQKRVSPLSIVFSIGLGVAALIFFSRLYIDLGEAVDPNAPGAKLGIRAALTIPLVLIAFLLFFNVQRKRPEFEVVIYPYFIVSMILLASLIIESGALFYERYQKVAIYVILFLVIAVLTGIILYIQKKIHESKK